MHLVRNALEAMSEGGALTVRTRAEADAVTIEIEDTGCGIPKAKLARIFDPQFNRRGDRARLGFGLSASAGIVADHGGQIALDSVEGEGTVACVTLPA